MKRNIVEPRGVVPGIELARYTDGIDLFIELGHILDDLSPNFWNDNVKEMILR